MTIAEELKQQGRPMEDELIHNPHDRFFKEGFSRLETAQEFFAAYLPSELATQVNWSTLRLEPGSFVDERLAQSHSDLLFSATFHGEPLLLYFLFEHQSTRDPDMPFRLLAYMVRIWEQWRKRTPEDQQGPPAIVPVVLHQGSDRWNILSRFEDWLRNSESARSALSGFVPNFYYLVVDLSQVPTEELRGGVLCRLFLTLLRAARLNQIEEWALWAQPLLASVLEGNLAIFRAVAYYIATVHGSGLQPTTGGPSTFERLISKLTDKRVKEGFMTIAEELIQKGRQQGVAEGKAEGRLQGQILGLQRALGLPPTPTERLAELDAEGLSAILRELEAEAHERGTR